MEKLLHLDFVTAKGRVNLKKRKISYMEASYKGWVYAKLNGAAPMIRPDPPPV